MDEKYFTPREIAARWKVHISTVHRLIQSGKLRSRKLGCIRVSKRDLMTFERVAL